MNVKIDYDLLSNLYTTGKTMEEATVEVNNYYATELNGAAFTEAQVKAMFKSSGFDLRKKSRLTFEVVRNEAVVTAEEI